MTYWNDMIKKLSCIYYFFLSIYCFGQSTIEEKFELPDEVKETSGLLFFNEKVITHNDSGDGPYLYEIDTINGNISRVITITNATQGIFTISLASTVTATYTWNRADYDLDITISNVTERLLTGQIQIIKSVS